MTGRDGVDMRFGRGRTNEPRPAWDAYFAEVRRVYKDAGLPSAREIAHELGISHTTVNDLLNGRRLVSSRMSRTILSRVAGPDYDVHTADVLWSAARAEILGSPNGPPRSVGTLEVLRVVNTINRRLDRIEEKLDERNQCTHCSRVARAGVGDLESGEQLLHHLVQGGGDDGTDHAAGGKEMGRGEQA